jgi:hypothetical protein
MLRFYRQFVVVLLVLGFVAGAQCAASCLAASNRFESKHACCKHHGESRHGESGHCANISVPYGGVILKVRTGVNSSPLAAIFVSHPAISSLLQIVDERAVLCDFAAPQSPPLPLSVLRI